MKRRGFLKTMAGLCGVAAAPAVAVANAADSHAAHVAKGLKCFCVPRAFEEFVPILHKHCGGIHHYYAHRPHLGETAHAHLSRKVDGSEPENGEPMFCGSCGKSTHYIDLVPSGGWAEKAGQ